jgi:hypothetical protein
MTKDQYWQCVKQAICDHPEWRTGQAAFNVLWEHRRDLSEQIRGTDLDPFYVRDRNSAGIFPAEFREWVEAHWDDAASEAESAKPVPSKLIQKADITGDFITEVNGYVVWWPRGLGGFLNAASLRELADELDRRNAAWDAQVRKDLEALSDEQATL